MARAPKRRAKDAPTIATSIRFDVPVKTALDKAARDDARSTSGLVQKVMTEWLKAKGYLK